MNTKLYIAPFESTYKHIHHQIIWICSNAKRRKRRRKVKWIELMQVNEIYFIRYVLYEQKKNILLTYKTKIVSPGGK